MSLLFSHVDVYIEDLVLPQKGIQRAASLSEICSRAETFFFFLSHAGLRKGKWQSLSPIGATLDQHNKIADYTDS